MKKRKLLSVVLAASLLASTVPATAWASEPNTEPVAAKQASARSGELTVSGDSASYEWQNDGQTLLVKGSGELTISGDISRRGKNIQIKNGTTANLNFSGVTIEDEDDFYLSPNAIANIQCENSTIAVSASQNTQLNLTFIDGNNGIEKITSYGAVTFDAPSDTSYGPYFNNQISAGSLTINGGRYNVWELFNIDKLTINDGYFSFQLDAQIRTNELVIHGGYFDKPWSSMVYISSDKYMIDGGSFTYDCDIAKNTVWECQVVDTKVLSYFYDEASGIMEYTVVDPKEITEHYDVVGSSQDFSYEGRTLILNDGANVTVSSDGQVCDQIIVDGDRNNPASATLTLDGVDFVGPMSGILVEEGCSLTLNLKANSNNNFETIVDDIAAIQLQDEATLTIDGEGALTVQSGGYAAAIGAGSGYNYGGTINIKDGHIEAYIDRSAAAIGGSFKSENMAINISGGDVVAESLGFEGTGIGGGYNPEINISGGRLNVKSLEGPGIGNGYDCSGGNVIITGGDITASATAAAIGGSMGAGDDESHFGRIYISGDETRIDASSSSGAAIGCGDSWNTHSMVDSISISGGNIFAKSQSGAGIGGGAGLTSVGTIEISGGTIEAYGGTGSAGIGAGRGGIGGTFSTGNGNPVIITDSISDHNSESVWNGVFIVDNMNGGVGKVYGNKVTPTNDFTIPEGKTLEVDAGQSLIVAKGITATNNGTVIRDAKGTVDVQGTWRGNPVVVRGSEEDVAVTGVQLNKRTLTLAPTATETLVATISPEDAANKSLRWSSSDSDVATVDANGKVTAVAEGQAVITVSTVDGGFTAQCTVTVSGTEEEKPGDETTSTETTPDGSTVTTTVDKNGVSTTVVELSKTAVEQAERNDMAVILPMVGVRATTNMNTAPSVTVDLPGRDAVKVEIPVSDLTPGTVAVLVDERGNETVIKNSVIGNNGLIVTLSDGDTVKILDNTQEYNDVAANHWAKDNIDYVTSRGLFVGVDAENFAPETSMTRAMIVSVLQRYAGDTTSASGNWYEGARQWAMENGISDGTNMNGNVTREQLVTMLYRYIGSPQVVGSLADYSDNASVSPYAEQAMVWAVRNGIIGGMTADTLAPQGLATRAQVAAILERFIAWEQA